MRDWVPVPEMAWIWGAVALLLTGATIAVASLTVPATMASAGVGAPSRGARDQRRLLALLAGSVLLFGVAIAQRWVRLGHGPFLTMFEILLSNLFSLGVAYAFAFWRLPAIRASAAVVMPVLAIMAAWLVSTDPADTVLPPTYDTLLLWFHVLLGKLFLGCTLVALGAAVLVLLRKATRSNAGLHGVPDDAALDRLAWTFMGVALVFETAMLIAGAVWAQDAWGRYWAWDPLETWAFLTWLLLVGSIHARLAMRLSPAASAGLIVGVFVLAFLTFFGVPFMTVAPHQGAV